VKRKGMSSGTTGGGGTNARSMPAVSGGSGYGHKGTMGIGQVEPKARGTQGSGAVSPKAKGVQGRG